MCVTDKEEEQGKKIPVGRDKSIEQMCSEKQVLREGGCTDEWAPALLSSGAMMRSVLLCKIRFICLSYTEVSLHLVPPNRQGYLERLPRDWKVPLVGKGPGCDILTENNKNCFLDGKAS